MSHHLRLHLTLVAAGTAAAAGVVASGVLPALDCRGRAGWDCALKADLLAPVTVMALGALAGQWLAWLLIDVRASVRAHLHAGDRLRLGRPPPPPQPVCAPADAMLLAAASWGRVGGAPPPRADAARTLAPLVWAAARERRAEAPSEMPHFARTAPPVRTPAVPDASRHTPTVRAPGAPEAPRFTRMAAPVRPTAGGAPPTRLCARCLERTRHPVDDRCPGCGGPLAPRRRITGVAAGSTLAACSPSSTTPTAT